MEREFDFDDILILPVDTSYVASRSDVDLSQWIGNKEKGFKLDLPIIGSPMKGIMNANLAIRLGELGGIGILHRFYDDVGDWEKELNSICLTDVNFGVATSLNSNDDSWEYALDSGANIVCIDIANGHLDELSKRVMEISNHIYKYDYSTLLMAGNVVTGNTALKLVNYGADLVRVGIGSGGLCSTRNFTGIGRPQISAIMDCVSKVNDPKFLVADGGIRNSGDIVKALCAGAGTVMVGSLLAKAHESAHNGIIYGGASRKLQEEYFHSVKSVEGLEKEIKSEMSLEKLFDQIFWRVKSAFTYLNAKTISEAQVNAKFIEVGRGSIKEL